MFFHKAICIEPNEKKKPHNLNRSSCDRTFWYSLGVNDVDGKGLASGLT